MSLELRLLCPNGEEGEKLCRSSYIAGCQDVPVNVTGRMALNPHLSDAFLFHVQPVKGLPLLLFASLQLHSAATAQNMYGR